jgi:O-antigen/teichoic acid export membrane protein
VPSTQAEDKVPRYFSLLLNLNLLVQWPVLAFTAAYHAEIVQVVFGGKFIEHSWMLPLIGAFATCNVISVPVTLVAQYEEKVQIVLWSKIFGIYNVAALLALLPIAGLYGAAIATGTAQAMKNGFIWWHVRDRARWTNARAALLSGLVLWGSVVAVCYLLKGVMGSSAILDLTAGAVVIGLGGLIHVRGAAISGSDRDLLGVVLRGREARIFRLIGLLREKSSPVAQVRAGRP